MGTPGMRPLPALLIRQLQRADALIVEADITRGFAPFPDTADCLPLAERISTKQYAELKQRCHQLDLPMTLLGPLPAWHIALLLQAHQAQRLGLRPDCGIDYQLLEAAHQQQIKVTELEGADSQMSLLRSLPENGQPLLNDTLQHWRTNARMLQTMVSWWLAAPPARTAGFSLQTTFSSEINLLLMQQRNRQWEQLLSQLPAGRYVVAVGAMHLYGEDNLAQMLDKKKADSNIGR